MQCANVTQHLIYRWSFTANFIAVPHYKLCVYVFGSVLYMRWDSLYHPVTYRMEWEKFGFVRCDAIQFRFISIASEWKYAYSVCSTRLSNYVNRKSNWPVTQNLPVELIYSHANNYPFPWGICIQFYLSLTHSHFFLLSLVSTASFCMLMLAHSIISTH